MTVQAESRGVRQGAGPRLSEEAALLLIGVGAAVAGAMAFLGAPLPPPLIPTIAHLSGMWAGYGVAVMLLLMARIPALERGVGADRLARWHAKGGKAILVLVLLHGATATLGWMQAQSTDPVSATVQVLGMPGLLAATAATAIFCAVGIVSARSARRRLSYETWHALHLSTYLAVGLSFAHELAGAEPGRSSDRPDLVEPALHRGVRARRALSASSTPCSGPRGIGCGSSASCRRGPRW